MRSTLIILLACITISLIGCSGTPKVLFQKTHAKPQIVGEGYAWGENSKEIAEKAALIEATGLVMPRAIEFTYLRAGQYEIFKTDRTEFPDLEEPKVLPVHGGHYAVVKGVRDKKVLRKMKFMVTVNFEVECENDSIEQRYQECTSLIYKKSMTEFAKRKFGFVPEKLKGNFSFFHITRENVSDDTLSVRVSAFVGFVGSGKISKEEKAMVLMNAWRQRAKAGKNGGTGTKLYRAAIKAFPNSNYAREFAMHEMEKGRYRNAAMAMKDAIKLNPHDIEPLKILYQIYKKSGNKKMMAKVEKKLTAMEAWEDNPGADIVNNLRYSTKVRWEENGNTNDTPGLIQFREMDEDEMEEIKPKSE